MKKTISTCIFLVVVIAQIFAQKPQAFSRSASPEQVGIDSERLIYIDRLLQQYVDDGIIPHALTFVAKDGVVIHNKAFGWKDIESRKQLKKDDIFREYSQTKAITTVALMTLFEQGKFQLDDPVSKYIPECTDQILDKLNEDGTYTTQKTKTPLTIRHLLSHTSGIMGRRELRTIYNTKFEEKKPYATLAEEVKDLVSLPLGFEPGSQWNYHPASDVWGYLVEYFSGKPLREYVKETIFDPLGMTDTDWYYPESYKERMVTAYNEKDGKLVPQTDVWSGRYPFTTDIKDMQYTQAGSGLNGTIEDYARFCQMIANGGTFNGKRILGRRTIELMSVDQLPHPNNGGNNFCFGLGFQIYAEDAKRTTVNNSSPMVTPGSLSWGGMYKTDYIIDPKENMVILLYTNRLPDTKIWQKFLNTVYQALE